MRTLGIVPPLVPGKRRSHLGHGEAARPQGPELQAQSVVAALHAAVPVFLQDGLSDRSRFAVADGLAIDADHGKDAAGGGAEERFVGSQQFGGGPRICKGRYLAKLEAELALKVLLEKTQSVQLNLDKPVWSKPGAVRVIQSLPVTLAGKR